MINGAILCLTEVSVRIQTCVLSMLLAAATAVAVAQKPVGAPPEVPKDDAEISASGCVEAGVEASCLILRSAKDDKIYNLLVKGEKPAAGAAISFHGTRHDGPTICMQGAAVDVSKWTPIKMRCSKTATPKLKK